MATTLPSCCFPSLRTWLWLSSPTNAAQRNTCGWRCAEELADWPGAAVHLAAGLRDKMMPAAKFGIWSQTFSSRLFRSGFGCRKVCTGDLELASRCQVRKGLGLTFWCKPRSPSDAAVASVQGRAAGCRSHGSAGTVGEDAGEVKRQPAVRQSCNGAGISTCILPWGQLAAPAFSLSQRGLGHVRLMVCFCCP